MRGGDKRRKERRQVVWCVCMRARAHVCVQKQSCPRDTCTYILMVQPYIHNYVHIRMY